MRDFVGPLVAVGIGTAIAVALALAPPPHGPLYEWQSDGGYNPLGFEVKPGQIGVLEYPFTRALPTRAVLLGMRPMRPQDARGVTLRYGVIAGGGGLTAGRTGWNLRALHAHPLAGFVLPAHTQGTFVVGASSRQVGVHHIRGFVLDYRIGGIRFSAPQQFGEDVCVKTPSSRCRWGNLP